MCLYNNNSLYEPLDIYKIGCTKDINRRLKTMMLVELLLINFLLLIKYQTFHYFKLEQGLHKLLKKDRLNNEVFSM